MSDDHGWSHQEARQHTVVERRLHERCATYGGGTCPDRGLQRQDWCERCLAAADIDDLRCKLAATEIKLRATRLALAAVRDVREARVAEEQQA